MPGIPWRMRPFLPSLATFLAMPAICLYCFKSRFTSCTEVPEPAATRRLRAPDRSLAFLRSAAVIDWMIATVVSSTIVAYSRYTFSAPDLPANHTMMLTIPFVIYGIFRYLFLIHVKGKGGAPDELIFKDGPLFTTALLWAGSSVLILYIF